MDIESCIIELMYQLCIIDSNTLNSAFNIDCFHVNSSYISKKRFADLESLFIKRSMLSRQNSFSLEGYSLLITHGFLENVVDPATARECMESYANGVLLF